MTAGTFFASTKLPLTTRFLAIYLLSQAKTGLSALALKRRIGVSHPTAWLMHHKIMEAMADREAAHRLVGAVEVDDAYLVGPAKFIQPPPTSMSAGLASRVRHQSDLSA